ncbi:MAG: tRNA 2-thiouridine(34) synthase MnmA [Bacteroidetes bacterium]|jgi:tRNA-specific 2-thiouridylase|nr:tRNA 2-thiouridine(34) synthase MnmA [Bacteroidota bacterium]
MSTKGRVLVAMSGGVDSSVAAVMLHEQGYDVIGITMKTWDYHRSGGDNGKETGCCTVESMNDARHIAVKYGFKHFIVDIRDEFGDWVIDRFVEEYTSGRTPNPCVLCNTHIKWAALLRRADNLGCDYIATGHYANVRKENGRFVISKGRDHDKDQSYALWGVQQKHLERTIFPLGGFRKTKIRKIAEEYGLLNVANKPDSYEICFIPDNNYHRFLNDRVDGLEERVRGGDFVDKNGNVVGKHKGYPYYTIGQRRGLDLALGYPVYVTDIDPVHNVITIGEKEDLVSTTCRARELNLVKYENIPGGSMDIVGKIRYNDDGASGTITQISDDEIEVHFPAGREAITPGQAIVCYEGDDVVAGGWIHKVNIEMNEPDVVSA